MRYHTAKSRTTSLWERRWLINRRTPSSAPHTDIRTVEKQANAFVCTYVRTYTRSQRTACGDLAMRLGRNGVSHLRKITLMRGFFLVIAKLERDSPWCYSERRSDVISTWSFHPCLVAITGSGAESLYKDMIKIWIKNEERCMHRKKFWINCLLTNKLH